MNLILAVLIAALRTGDTAPELIAPGAGAGGVYLGQLPEEVHRRLGNPPRVFEKDGVVKEVWGDYPRVQVFYKGGRVLQVWVELTRFRTADGVGPGASFAQVRKLYGQRGFAVQRSTSHSVGGGARIFYYDVEGQGIAFRFVEERGAGGNRSSFALRAVVVHPIDRPVLKDLGEVPVPLHEDRCSPEAPEYCG